MRILFAMWAIPMTLFWGWYFLSVNDINFGYLMLTRQLHDVVFQMYGEVLGIDPATIPGLVARACIFDTAIVAAIIAFRRRKAIAARFRTFRARYSEAAPSV